MSNKVWVLCHEDNFGQIDLHSICGGYSTKKQAEAELKRITDKFGPQGFVIRQVDYAIIAATCI